MATNLSKKVAFITGANKGLGFEIAKQLGHKGYVVVLGCRDMEKGKKALKSLQNDGIDAYQVKLDVSNEQDVKALAPYFEKTFGRLDVLVNNAGVAEWSKNDINSFRATFEANVFGAVAVTYSLLDLIKKSPDGRIVNQSSLLGSLSTLEKDGDQFGNFINVAYTSSKAALNGFTVALANKLKGTNVKVNSAHPGWVKTDMGGDAAPLEVGTGAQTAVDLATIGANGPSGEFFHMGQRLPW